eukprot:gene3544-668_t
MGPGEESWVPFLQHRTGAFRSIGCLPKVGVDFSTPAMAWPAPSALALPAACAARNHAPLQLRQGQPDVVRSMRDMPDSVANVFINNDDVFFGVQRTSGKKHERSPRPDFQSLVSIILAGRKPGLRIVGGGSSTGEKIWTWGHNLKASNLIPAAAHKYYLECYRDKFVGDAVSLRTSPSSSVVGDTPLELTPPSTPPIASCMPQKPKTPGTTPPSLSLPGSPGQGYLSESNLSMHTWSPPARQTALLARSPPSDTSTDCERQQGLVEALAPILDSRDIPCNGATGTLAHTAGRRCSVPSPTRGIPRSLHILPPYIMPVSPGPAPMGSRDGLQQVHIPAPHQQAVPVVSTVLPLQQHLYQHAIDGAVPIHIQHMQQLQQMQQMQQMQQIQHQSHLAGQYHLQCNAPINEDVHNTLMYHIAQPCIAKQQPHGQATPPPPQSPNTLPTLSCNSESKFMPAPAPTTTLPNNTDAFGFTYLPRDDIKEPAPALDSTWSCDTDKAMACVGSALMEAINAIAR